MQPDLRGDQYPRIWCAPESVSTTGLEAVELASLAGLELDPWQEFVISNSLGEREDGKWAAFEVGLLVSRQNGKGGILEARELAGLFLIERERLIIHSAHQFDTSLEAFRRLLSLVENTPSLSKRIRRVSNAHGSEGLELKNGKRIRFRTRTKGGGRGFSCDCLVLDEAMDIPEATHAALLPTLSARPNPQVWYTGSAVDKDVDDNGTVFTRIRERGVAGNDPSLAYFEWSADLHIERVSSDDTLDPAVWAQANPALGIRIPAEYVERERATLSTRKFAVERLSVGNWPSTADDIDRVIPRESWSACIDLSSTALDPVCFALDVTHDRSFSAISAASRRADGLLHIEVIEHARGTGWVAERLAELHKTHRPRAIVVDAGGPAGSIVADIEKKGVPLFTISAKEHAQACGMFYDSIMDSKTLRHLNTAELTAAVDGASTRPLGEAWAWSRRSSGVDISPLVACTLALWGVLTQGGRRPEVHDLNEVIARINERESGVTPPTSTPGDEAPSPGKAVFIPMSQMPSRR